MRCCMCDYCSTTDTMSGEEEVEAFRQVLFDGASQQHYCEKCITEWNITLAEYTPILEPNREIDNDN